MTLQQPDTQLSNRFIWGGILTVLTTASTLAVACGTPFAALATLAALFLPRRDALVLIAVNWLANQAIGFGLLHYPLNWDCYRGGISLGIAALLSTMAAMLAQGALRNAATAVRAIGSAAVDRLRQPHLRLGPQDLQHGRDPLRGGGRHRHLDRVGADGGGSIDDPSLHVFEHGAHLALRDVVGEDDADLRLASRRLLGCRGERAIRLAR